jgi:hypothetical protein
VDEKDANGNNAAPKSRTERKAKTWIEEFFIVFIVISPW